jgi:hypothetical protein
MVREVCNHTFRGTGVTAYLENGGTLEKARQMAAHASTRTTQLYDRREDRVTPDEDRPAGRAPCTTSRAGATVSGHQISPLQPRRRSATASGSTGPTPGRWFAGRPRRAALQHGAESAGLCSMTPSTGRWSLPVVEETSPKRSIDHPSCSLDDPKEKLITLTLCIAATSLQHCSDHIVRDAS